jgi:glycerol dehydrogenase
MLSIFCAPARYVQGRNATEQLGSELSKLGFVGAVMIIAGSSARRLLEATWERSLGDAGFKCTIADFSGECSENEIERLRKIAKSGKTKVIVGAGGGKVLDTARAVAAELDLPIINCPTVASSDAPCSALSVVYSPAGEFERYIFYRRNPDLVLVDTSMIAQAPSRLLVAGMGDALATWFEADTVFNAQKANQVGGRTTISAHALAKLCYETLINDGVAAVRAVEQHQVTPELDRLVEANTLLSGLGFESGGLAIAHSIHNGLTTIPQTHHYLHGEKVAFGLITQLVAENKSQSLIQDVLRFCVDVGLPCTLRELGIEQPTEDQLRSIAVRASAPGETAHNEPFPVDERLLKHAIVNADALGREFRATVSSGT